MISYAIPSLEDGQQLKLHGARIVRCGVWYVRNEKSRHKSLGYAIDWTPIKQELAAGNLVKVNEFLLGVPRAFNEPFVKTDGMRLVLIIPGLKRNGGSLVMRPNIKRAIHWLRSRI